VGFAPGQTAGFVVILYDVDNAVLVCIALDYGQGTVGAKGFYDLRSAVVVVVADFANQNAAGVLLDKVNLAIKVPVALYLHQDVSLDGFNQIRAAVAIGIDQYLVFVAAAAHYPLVRTPVATAMGYGTVRPVIAGEERER